MPHAAGKTQKLHWQKLAAGHYTSVESLDGVADFEIRRYRDRAAGGVQWRCKMRSSARSVWFNTLGDAKTWAEHV